MGLDEYEWVEANDRWSIDKLQSFDGRRKKDTWEIEEFTSIYDDGKPRLIGDFVLCASHIPIISERALSILRPILADDAEVLPISIKGKPFYIINVTTVLNCLNYEKSKYICFPDSNRIMLIEQYVFDRKKISKHNVFRLIDEPRRYVFVTDAFKVACEENGFTGCEFEFLWSAENS